MSEVLLKVDKREESGKKVVKGLRRSGKVPGVYYIHGEDSVPVMVDEKELRNVVHSESSIIDLEFDDGKKAKSVIREVQWDPLYGAPLHVDFMGIKLTEKIHVALPLHLIGTPEGVKQHGGVLQHIVRELDIECLPLDIPEHYEIDVSVLEIGDTIKVEDLSIDNVEILNEPYQTILVVRPPVLVTEPEEEEVEEGAEPELIGEEKEGDEDEDAQEEKE